MSHSIQQTHMDPEVVPGTSLSLLWYWRWYWWYWRCYKLRWYLVPHINGLLFMDGCLQQQRVIQFNPRHHCWIDQSLNQQWENVLEHIAVLDTLCVQYCLSLLKTFMTTRESLLFDELQGFYMLIDELPRKSYEALPSTKKTEHTLIRPNQILRWNVPHTSPVH